MLLAVIMNRADALPEGFNYDQSKVPKYQLPDPLVMADGTKVADAKTWMEKRRAEILELFETEVYGRAPGKPAGMTFEVTSVDKQALGGKAIRKEVRVYFTNDKAGPKMDVLIYLPQDRSGPTAIFLGLNFHGNHSIHKDPGITLSEQWVINSDKLGVKNNNASEVARGAKQQQSID